MAGVAPPVFYGRGMFNYTFGLLPFRLPIHTVGKQYTFWTVTILGSPQLCSSVTYVYLCISVFAVGSLQQFIMHCSVCVCVLTGQPISVYHALQCVCLCLQWDSLQLCIIHWSLYVCVYNGTAYGYVSYIAVCVSVFTVGQFIAVEQCIMHCSLCVCVTVGQPIAVEQCIMHCRLCVCVTVGNPIAVEQCNEPTQEQIDKYHSLYMKDLKTLFDEYKVKYGISKSKELKFVQLSGKLFLNCLSKCLYSLYV